MCESNGFLTRCVRSAFYSVQHETRCTPTVVSATSTSALQYETPARSQMTTSGLSSASWSTPPTVPRPNGGMRGVGGTYERVQTATRKDLQKTRLTLENALETNKVRLRKFIDKYSHSRDVIAVHKTHAFKLRTPNKDTDARLRWVLYFEVSRRHYM